MSSPLTTIACPGMGSSAVKMRAGGRTVGAERDPCRGTTRDFDSRYDRYCKSNIRTELVTGTTWHVNNHVAADASFISQRDVRWQGHPPNAASMRQTLRYFFPSPAQYFLQVCRRVPHPGRRGCASIRSVIPMTRDFEAGCLGRSNAAIARFAPRFGRYRSADQTNLAFFAHVETRIRCRPA